MARRDAIAYLGKLPAAKARVDAHSALRYASPSEEAVEELIKFWRNRSDDGSLNVCSFQEACNNQSPAVK